MPKTDTSFSTYTSMMRVTSNGRPYTKDLYDMFAAVLLQINLSDHRVMFRTYPSTFSTEEAAKVLSSLVFIHIHRKPDPNNPNRQIATRTTTTFSMDSESAKVLLQKFLSAGLIMNATDPTNLLFREKGFWTPTIKGKFVLEEFTDTTQVEMKPSLINALSVLSSTRVLNLDRLEDDQITFSRPNMTAVFKSMMVSLPRETLIPEEFGGIEKKNLNLYQYTFIASHCLEWLCEHLTVNSKEEAENIASEFILFGWISQIVDKADRAHHEDKMVFKAVRNTYYYVTDRGCIAIGWKPTSTSGDENSSGVSLDSSDLGLNKIIKRNVAIKPMTTNKYQEIKDDETSIEMVRQDSGTAIVSEPPTVISTVVVATEKPPRPLSISLEPKDGSQWAKLEQVLEAPLMRMYFREFLRSNYCVENINFWVDYHKLLKITKVKEQLSECYSMYETYLGPFATADLNIDHTLHQEIIKYVGTVFVVVNQIPNHDHYFINIPHHEEPTDPLLLLIPSKKQKVVATKVSPQRCLAKLLKLFEKVNDHVCLMMAEDSIPKFIKTDIYKDLVLKQKQQEGDQQEEEEEDDDDEIDFEDSSDEEQNKMNKFITSLAAQRVDKK